MMKKPPIVHGHWLFKNIFNVFPSRVLTFVHESRVTHGDVFNSRGIMGDTHYIANPHLLEQVFDNHPDMFVKSDTYKTLRIFMGTGLFGKISGDIKKQRRLVQPAFSKKATSDLINSMKMPIDSIAKKWESAYLTKTPRNITEDMQDLALDIICLSVFGLDSKDKLGIVKESVNMLNAYGWLKMVSPIKTPMWWPSKVNRSLNKATRSLHGFCREIIRKKQVSPGSDLLSIIVHAIDKDTGDRLSEDDVLGEVVNILLAGHETSAKTMAILWYEMAKNPDIFARVQSEVRSKTIQKDTLAELVYCDKVVKEALRVNPSIWIIERSPIKDLHIGEYAYKKGDYISIPIYEIHHHEKYWPDPYTFDPERFNEDLVQTRPKYSYIPFGAGARYCIGAHFAQTELVMTLALLAQQFNVSLPATPYEHILLPHITLGTKYPIMLDITKNSSQL